MQLSPRLEGWRVRIGPYASQPGASSGAFRDVPGPHGRQLLIIAADGHDTGWEHVSVSLANRKHVPTWAEMCFVKDLFWEGETGVIQLHPPQSMWVNNVVNCLHLWRYKHGE